MSPLPSQDQALKPPSIDAAWQSLQTHMSTYNTSKESLSSRHAALIATKTLLHTLQDGPSAFFDRLEAVTANNILNFLCRLDLPSKIPSEDGSSISASELARSLNAEPDFLVRLMRSVCCYGVFVEVEKDRYAHNPQSRILLVEGYKCCQDYFFDVVGRPLPDLYGYFFEEERDGSGSGNVNANSNSSGNGEKKLKRPLESPTHPTDNPLSWSHGMPGKDFLAISTRDPERLERFTKTFAGRWGGQVPVMGIYPFDEELEAVSRRCEEERRVFIVDVGGSQGDSMKEVRETYPSLSGAKIVVQDLKPTIDSIPEGFLPEEYGIEAMVHDFMTEQPVKKAGVYYLRRILHDWPDEKCVRILRRLVDAMGDGEESRVLVAEAVVPERVQIVDSWVYSLDIMMMMLGGRERTRGDWERLFERAGLEVVRVWRDENGGTAQGVVEGRKKKC